MKWEHTCSLDWLKARQHYLCASDIKRLLPFTKTGKARKVTDEDRLAVYADKIKILTAEDCISYGAAARGHVLEPFAIDSANKHILPTVNRLFHWDDIVIPSKLLPIAYSPDALNVTSDGVPIICTEHDGDVIGEVKCYGADRHLKTIATDRMEREERWQIATAMAADSKIRGAYLILFNPEIDNMNLDISYYPRGSLTKEIQIVDKVAIQWQEFIDSTFLSDLINDSYDDAVSIEEIADSLSKRNSLNPG